MKRKKPLILYYLLPNILTILGLIIGVSAIRFGLESKWEISVYCTVIAAVIDGMDGRIARILNASSEFGAELDSLCDFVNFAISPTLIIYLWSFQQYEFKILSWLSMMIFIVCMAIRLARFNVKDTRKNTLNNKTVQIFLTGIPAPAGALLILVPMMLNFALYNVRKYTLFIDIYIICIGLLLASKIPTISIKHIRINRDSISTSMMITSIIIIVTIIYPWYALPVIGVVYLLTIPCCYYFKKKLILN
ncbi:CDP-alcohol phosphatidyltransferase family protein [Rickettsia endosymbiont of Cardiosporidium cionae]|uniref:CDP-alcohol phosphatidyltransferase family protein n=1 Tax=Rickettsia endosymbiont of Cardiosporidium cionae TaxID=2777155 RepID=UPI001896057D|nr:phosphatidylcholine/phosphatidylserine synthase [Rickettsia endosymbiont of Cardiosporidium cionae]KAF8818729.1 phosphatidylcholine/phosphatidylserine synthase [Rickettsia endosymbiont of Cardiosporidium cionae]